MVGRGRVIVKVDLRVGTGKEGCLWYQGQSSQDPKGWSELGENLRPQLHLLTMFLLHHLMDERALTRTLNDYFESQ